MTSGDKFPLSAGEVLKCDYFQPSGRSLNSFAKLVGVGEGTLSKVLNENARMGFKFIDKISSYTATSTTYWHHLQSDFQFAEFLSKRAENKLPPISSTQTPQKKKNILVDEIFYKYLLPDGQNIATASEKLKISAAALSRIINGRRAIDRSLVEKLYSTLRINPLYWFKLQTYYEISRMLNHGRLPSELEERLTCYFHSIATREFLLEQGEGRTEHPGQILRDQFIVPSGDRLRDWCRIFRISKSKLMSILSGTTLMPVSFMLKVYRLFDIDICYWLDLQINYHSAFILERIAPIRHHLEKKLKSIQTPGAVLYNEYIIPMKWSMHDFADHIKISYELLRNIRYGEKAIDFELACRLGEALEMDPRYWIRLQLDHSIYLYNIRRSTITLE